ncbi:MAG TPA: condensation domain-containing protein [Candidatus Dormibacteraeota bacterium]
MTTATLAGLLAARAAATPYRVAISVDGGEDLDYGTWQRRSSAQARGLVDTGVARGARAVIVVDSRAWTEYAVSYIAVQMAAAVAVPLPRSLSAVEVERVVREVDAAVILAPCSGGDAPPINGIEATDPCALERTGADLAVGLPAAPLPAPSAIEILCVSRPLSRLELHPRTLDDVLRSGGVDRTASRGEAACVLHVHPVGGLAAQAALVDALNDPPLSWLVIPAFDPKRIAELVATRSIHACSLHPGLARAIVESRALEGHDIRILDAPALAPRSSRPPSDAPVAPVSTAQEGMLWHEVFAPGCQNLQGLARRIHGPLDAGALERALREIVRRHRPLRTTFELRAARLVQIVHAPDSFRMATGDMAALSADAREAEVQRMVADAGRRPFDLVNGPLFEATLVSLAADEHVLIIRTHHTVFDEWSVAVFRKELSALYTAFAEGRPSPLPEPVIGFEELAERQRETLSGPEGARQTAFWRRELAGAPLTTQLPVGDPALPPGTPSPPGGPIELEVPADVSASARELARRERATVFMVLLAAFGMLTTLTTGQDDLLLSIIVANRDQSERHDLIGSFAKKVPLRLRVDGDPTFAQVIARTRSSVLGALSAPDLPFEALMQDVLGPAAARHGLVPHPAVLFQSMTRGPELTLAGVTSAGFETSRRANVAHFMAASATPGAAQPRVPWGAGVYHGTFVNITLDAQSDQLSCVARGAFHGPRMREFLDSFGSLLAAVVARSSLRLSELRASPAGGGDAESGDLIDLRGFRVDIARIEEVLRECPGVAGVQVHLEPDDTGDGELVADVDTAEHAARPTPELLRAWLWSRLPGYPWPARFKIASGPAAAPASAPQTAQMRFLRVLHDEAAADAGVAAPATHYWQSLPFLEALARARDAGVQIPGRLVARNRTIGGLATADTAERMRSAGTR